MGYNDKYDNDCQKKFNKGCCCERVIREVCYYPDYLNEDCYDRKEKDNTQEYKCNHDKDYDKKDDKMEKEHTCNCVVKNCCKFEDKKEEKNDCENDGQFHKGWCCRCYRKDEKKAEYTEDKRHECGNQTCRHNRCCGCRLFRIW